ncbi:MAG: hypothetical protein H6715_04975 [Myxococcales bacterium]|nr:hypothetical protein [Myxococcales bacterium]
MGRGVTGVEAAGNSLSLDRALKARASLRIANGQAGIGACTRDAGVRDGVTVRALGDVVTVRIMLTCGAYMQLWVAHRGFVIGALGVLQTGDALA